MAQVETITGVINRFATDAVLPSSFPGGLWLDEIPPKTEAGADFDITVQGAFVVLVDGGDELEYSSESAYVERRKLTFLVFAVGATATLALGQKVRASFRIYGEVANGVQWIKFELTGSKIMIDPTPATNGARVFIHQLDYDVERMGDIANW